MTNQEAIEELKKVDTLDMPARLCEAHYMAIKTLEQEPKTGHWIDDGRYADGHSEHAYRCSECEEHYIGYVGEYKHCPNCGADMRGDTE